MANTRWAEEPEILFLSFFRNSGDRSKMIIEFLTFEWDTFHPEKKKRNTAILLSDLCLIKFSVLLTKRLCLRLAKKLSRFQQFT